MGSFKLDGTYSRRDWILEGEGKVAVVGLERQGVSRLSSPAEAALPKQGVALLPSASARCQTEEIKNPSHAIGLGAA